MRQQQQQQQRKQASGDGEGGRKVKEKKSDGLQFPIMHVHDDGKLQLGHGGLDSQLTIIWLRIEWSRERASWKRTYGQHTQITCTYWDLCVDESPRNPPPRLGFWLGMDGQDLADVSIDWCVFPWPSRFRRHADGSLNRELRASWALSESGHAGSW